MKAQFEAMGLAMIVILVSLGMFLLIIFNFGEQSDAPQRYETQQLAQNTVSAMVRVSVPNCDLEYDDLIEDAALYERMPCGRDSVEIIGEITETILKDTLEKRQLPYKYVIRELGNEEVEPIYELGTCNPEVQDVEAPGRRILRLPPTTKTVEAVLWLC